MVTEAARGRIYINACNVHQGGGAVLLNALIYSGFTAADIVLLVDERMAWPQPVPESVRVIRVRATLWQRLKADWWLARQATDDDVVLNFGNLPRIFAGRGFSAVFIQNRYLVDGLSLVGFPAKARVRIRIERGWLRCRARNSDVFVVQTPTMGEAVSRQRFARSIPVRVLPFHTRPVEYARALSPGRVAAEAADFRFLYVASGEPHKNHRQLIEAWTLLAQQGHFPLLILTLREQDYPDLLAFIYSARTRFGIRIENRGILAQDALAQEYRSASAMVYPSTSESFGLPLVEARQAGLPILAAECDYVRDIIDPDESFAPDSPVSIARAVKRFMGVCEPALGIDGGAAFLSALWASRGGR